MSKQKFCNANLSLKNIPIFNSNVHLHFDFSEYFLPLSSELNFKECMVVSLTILICHSFLMTKIKI